MELSEINSQLILDHLSSMIYIIDKHYQIIDCNYTFADYVKLSKKDIIGQPCYKVTHNSDTPCWKLKDTICPAITAFQKNKKCHAIHKHFLHDTVVVEEVISTPICNGKYALEEFRNLSDLLGLAQGILPICAGCKKIRDEQGRWYELEGYFHDKTGIDFSHSICPECAKRLYPEF